MNVQITPFVLEPGNRTRYDLDVIHINPHDMLVTLYRDRSRVAGSSMKFFTSKMRCIYRPYDVSKTMGCEVTAAAVILAFLRSEYGLYVDLGLGFNQDTGVWVGETRH